MPSRQPHFPRRIDGKARLLACILLLPLLHGGTGLSEEWARHTIDGSDGTARRAGADGVRFADLDGDGLPDVVTGWEEGGKVRVCLHPGFEKVREPWPAVTVGEVESPEDAAFADLDGDGRLEVVSATEGKGRSLFVHWSPGAPERLLDSDAWLTDRFPLPGPKQWWMQILPRDVDRDGWIDLIVGSKNAGASVSWLRNPGAEAARDLSRWEFIPLHEAGWIMSLEWLGDGPGEGLVYSDRKGARSGIHFLPALDHAPWFGDPVAVGAAGEEVMFIDLADIDADGRDEVVAAIRPASVRVFRQAVSGAGSWTLAHELDPLPWNQFGTVKAVRHADLDGGGTGKFAITCENATETRCGALVGSMDSRWTAIGGGGGVKFDRIELLDLDGDGDLDLATCEEREGLGVVWYENPLR